MPLKGEARRLYEIKRRKEAREYLLTFLGGRCVVCGTSENLEFHHINPQEKEYKVSTLTLWSINRALEEVRKCELRCIVHHREIHAARHGTISMYGKGCRCDLCLEAKSSYRKIWQNKYRRDGRDKSRKNYGHMHE